MKKIVLALIGFVLSTAPALAALGPSVDGFECAGDQGDFTLVGHKQDCVDPRYQQWQKNGCYLVTITTPARTFSLEMVRNVPYHLEQRQKFYSFMTYDADEWVLQGLAVRMGADDESVKFRYDTRKTGSGPFDSTYGYCQNVK